MTKKKAITYNISIVNVLNDKKIKLKGDIVMNKELSKLVSELNWKVSEEEVNNIVNELGEDAEKSKYGVRYYQVLKNIVCNKVDEELNLEESEITCKSIALGGVAFTNATVMSSGGAVYYRVVVTKTKIYNYSFDYFFKLVNKFEYDLSEIKEIKIAEAGQDGIVPYDGYLISFNDGKLVALYSINKFAVKDLDALKDALIAGGVSYRPLKTKKISTAYFGMTAAIVFVIIMMVIRLF